MHFDPDTCFSQSNGNLLADHLFYVGKLLYQQMPRKKELAFFCGIFHDFGKTTSFYQKYIQAKMKGSEAVDVDPAEKSHTAISILFSIYFFSQYLRENDYKYIIPIISSLNHHSRLINFEDLLYKKLLSSKKKDILKTQIDDLKQRIAVLDNLYKRKLSARIKKTMLPKDQKQVLSYIINLDFADFFAQSRNIRQIVLPVYDAFNAVKGKSIELAAFNLTLYGHLISADRKMAGKLPAAYNHINHADSRLNRLELPKSLITKYVQEEFGTKDKYKTRLFQTVEQRIECDPNQKYNIFNISAPTGSGKTETALNAAFRLLSKTSAERIIYALPLTNLLDQNYNRIRNILTKYIPDFDQDSNDYLLKYHYCAEYNDTDNEEDSIEILKKAEHFDSKFIITTYVQLLYSFISNSPNYLFRQSKLSNAIIILDEPQILNPEHHHLISRLLLEKLERSNSKLILMTATDPLIFPENKYLNLTKGIDQHENLNNRTKIIPKLQLISDTGLISFVEQNLLNYNSILIVLNTIKSSIELYKKFKDRPALKKYQVYYLSTNLIPSHRDAIVDEIERSLASGKNIILVSTQVIEAGIDFDFQVGIRDLAPFDSLVQTAGRVNRKGLQVEGKLYIPSLEHEDNGSKLAEYIYNKTYLSFTRDILKQYKHIPEALYTELINKYFHKIKYYLEDYNLIKNESNPVYNLINFEFDELDNNFNIIEEKFYQFPIILPFDNVDQILDQYKNISIALHKTNYQEKWDLHQQLKIIRRKLYPYIINISNSSFPLLKDYIIPDEESCISWAKVVNKNFLSEIYDYSPDTKIGQGLSINSRVETLWI